MGKMKLWMLAAILLCGTTVLLTSCSKDDSSSGDTPSITKAKYGIIIYGNTGGKMDGLIEENFFDMVAPLLTDPSKVRVGVCYKYGRDKDNTVGGYTFKHTFNGKYANAGQVVMFELNAETPLSEGSLGKNYGKDWPEMRMFDEETLTEVINHFKETMPAEKYIMLIYGHGGGWDQLNDYVREAPEPGARGFTRGVLYDEWSETVIGSDALSMYEFRRAVEKSQIPHFDGVFMHSCLMGNMESLADLYPISDYTVSCMHSLNSGCESMRSLVKELLKGTDFPTSAKAAFKDCYEEANKGHASCNGDMNLLDNKEFEKLFPICKKLSSRLQALYPDKKAEINKAIENDIYVVDPDFIFVDLQYYADQMAKATGDAELKTIADELKAQMDKTILAANHYYNSPYTKGIKPDFSLSVVVVDHNTYIGEAGLTHSFKTAYEYTKFHKQTGWGDWLNILEAKPTENNPAGGISSD